MPGVLLEQFAQEFRAASCERIVGCNFMPDLETCLSSTGTDRGVAQNVASVQSGEFTYDPAAARACVEGIRTASCAGDYTLFPRTLRELCDPVFGNRKGEGAPCFHAAECQGVDARCEGACDDSCCVGQCRLSGGVKKLGETCSDTEPCDDDLYCFPDNTYVCKQRVGPGASCDSPYACIAGYACDPATQTCFKQADSGAQCNPSLSADGCAAIADYCHPDEAKCVPYPGTGAPCANTPYAQNFCAPSNYCDFNVMTCVAMPKAGDPCVGDQCLGDISYGVLPGLTCDNGVCAQRPEIAVCAY